MQERRPNADRRQETRSALLAAARALFLDKGFAGTGTPEVVAQAGVTRGALYHHFRDKQALFLAVIEAEAAAIAAEIDSGAEQATDPRAALRQGAAAYFAAMRHPGRVRLMLLEGPAVLGAAQMRDIDRQTGGRSLRQGLEAALPGTPAAKIDILADLVSAMFDRAALAASDDASAAAYAAALDEALTRLLP